MSSNTLLPSSSKKLYGKRVLVIGGSSGIGFAIACAAYDNGAQIIISSSSETKIASAVEKIRSGYSSPPQSSTIDGFACDLADANTLEANLQSLLERATKDGPLDHITFSAGNTLNIKPLAEITVELIQSSGIVRFIAPLILAKLVHKRNQTESQRPFVRPEADSSITFTTGTANDKPEGRGWEVVCGYAAGLEGAVRAMVFDLKPVRVNAVSPGAIETDLYSEASDERLEHLKNETMTGRLGRPSDLAEAYLYCMRDGFFTGKILQSDGGRLLK